MTKLVINHLYDNSENHIKDKLLNNLGKWLLSKKSVPKLYFVHEGKNNCNTNIINELASIYLDKTKKQSA